MVVELIVRVVYEPSKASDLRHMSGKEVAFNIRRDFDALKLPHPREGNIREPKRDGVTVSWSAPRHSRIYMQITTVVDQQDSDSFTREAKYRRYIRSLHLNIDAHSDRPHELTKKIDPVLRSLRQISDSLHAEAKDKPKARSSPARSYLPTAETAGSQSRGRDENIARLIKELQSTQDDLKNLSSKAEAVEKELLKFQIIRRAPGHDQLDSHEKLTWVTSELEVERKVRQEAEQILADVQRECNHPEVVPTILQLLGNNLLSP